MATAALRRSPATGRMAVAGWISGGIAVLLTALLGVVAAAQLRLAATLLSRAWFGQGLRVWLP
jgi:hypothetical protein